MWVPSPESGPGASILDVSDEELRINRLNTRAFIETDPIDVRLRFAPRLRGPAGAWTRGEVQVRPEQRFKLIMQSPAGGSIDAASGEDGSQQKIDYVLLGEWDAEIAAGDFWDDEHGNRWEVSSLIPTNAYELRANLTAYGSANVLEGG